MFKNTVQELAKALQVDVPTPTDNGAYAFSFDDNTLEVNILPLKNNALILLSPVSNPLNNSQETEQLFKKLLQINFSRLKDYEEILTWDPDSDQITLTQEIPFSTLSEKPLLGQLEQFLDNLEFWKSATAQQSTTAHPLPQ